MQDMRIAEFYTKFLKYYQKTLNDTSIASSMRYLQCMNIQNK